MPYPATLPSPPPPLLQQLLSAPLPSFLLSQALVSSLRITPVPVPALPSQDLHVCIQERGSAPKIALGAGREAVPSPRHAWHSLWPGEVGMGQANFRRRRCPPRTGAERPAGWRGAELCRSPPRNDPLPVPTRERDVAATLGSPGASERSLSPRVPRSPPWPWDEVSVRWGPSVAAPLPRGHLPGTESSRTLRCWEKTGVHK